TVPPAWRRPPRRRARRCRLRCGRPRRTCRLRTWSSAAASRTMRPGWPARRRPRSGWLRSSLCLLDVDLRLRLRAVLPARRPPGRHARWQRAARYWRLPSVSSAWPTLFCEVAALLDMNCIFRLSAVSLTMFEGWSPPLPMTSDRLVIFAAWPSSVWPQAFDIASYQLPPSVDEAPGRPIDAAPALLPTKLSTGLMLLFMVFSPLRAHWIACWCHWVC